jgi:hypothetical protein
MLLIISFPLLSGNCRSIDMLLPNVFHTIALLWYHTSAVPLLHPCRTLAIPLPHPCRTLAIPLSYPCRTLAAPLPYLGAAAQVVLWYSFQQVESQAHDVAVR